MSEVQCHRLRISEAEAGLRLDQALARLLGEYSRAAIKTWIDAGDVTLNARSCRPRDAVRAGDEVYLRATLQASASLQAQPVAFGIAHVDEACIVVNKPAGLVVHPGAGNPQHTLANGLLAQFPELHALPRAGLIHRLDQHTSGLLVVARTQASYQQLIRAMAAREITRVYDALVNGEMISGGTVDTAIGRDPRQRTRMAVRASGRAAVTHYRVTRRFRSHTHIEVQLETGRTHQIRVHMASLGHPLVGDARYGAKPRLPRAPHPMLAAAIKSFARQALHARRLTFAHPVSAQTISVEAALPDDLKTLLDACAIDAARSRDR